MPAPTVFISYSHKDEAWKDRLLPQLKALEQAGVGMRVWHDRKIDGGDKWYPEIQDAMANAAAAILLISQNFLSSQFCVQEEVPALLKRQEEQGMLLIPVLVRPCVWKAHRWLKDRQMIPRDGQNVAVDFAGDRADLVFTAVAEQVLGHFEQLVARFVAGTVSALVQQLPARRTMVAEPGIVPPAPAAAWPKLPAERIDLTRLPETGSALFGRNDELALLDRAWAGPEPANTTPVRVLVFTAYGGVGKSTLVNHWLAEMAREHYRGAASVFGWSFFSQGAREGTVASADSFVDAALRFFGDPDPSAGSPWDKGERLAHRVGSARALLVLDGMEPLQSPHAFDRGKLRDPALESLLRRLARQSAGLCLVTTREPVMDLARRPGVSMRDLEEISSHAGRALLRTARVVGTDAELEALASRFGPHALAVSLLGVYLREQPGRGITPAALERLPGQSPINRVLAGFEQWLGEGPERDALRLLGLFDRPADRGCLNALRRAPIISGLTDRLAGMDDAEWDRVLDRLEKLELLHVQHGISGLSSVDTHPLVREHFAVLLKDGAAWREGHRRLYKHLFLTTKEGDQPTLEDLQPLYQAVAHGCQAGMRQEACDLVYNHRIHRGREAYSVKTLGAFGSDLGAVACFFEEPWSRISPTLSEPAQAWLLNEAGFRLSSLGRLTEAREPFRAALKMRVRQGNWVSAAVIASNLSDLELTLGEMSGAVENAAQAVTYADRGGDPFQRMSRRAFLANTAHQAGHRSEAETRFRESEQMQSRHQPGVRLFSVQGFHYCDLLLAPHERAAWQRSLRSLSAPHCPTVPESCHDVAQRAAQALRVAESKNLLLEIALDHLTLGRAALYEAVLEGSSFQSCRSAVQHAVDGFRRAGQLPYLPLGFLTRAWCSFAEAAKHRLLDQRKQAEAGEKNAQGDLDEAWEIAERGPMPLFLADIHLHRARLFGPPLEGGGAAKYPWESAHHDLDEARRLVEKHGYWRRKEELEDAEEAAKQW